ncbi:MAG: lactate racemase domain-containing protein [Candidatus Poribacteria bacterium]|nr:lactate racemase domain-containing protein [Candidatus Poribacteria bacterium]
MSTYIAHGGKDAVITTEEKRALLQEALLKLGGIPKKILVIPPDITRFHSNAGELTRILYELWNAANGTTFDILPAIGTHAPMTEAQIAEMYGDLPKATYHVHHWRTGLYHFGEVPSDFIREVSDGKLDYSIPVAVNQKLVEGDYELIISVGQVIPHEVIGIANGFKNVLVGTGGVEMINKSHFLGAVDGMERLMGRTDTSVRRVLNYAHTHYLKQLGIVYVMSVMDVDENGDRVMRGLYIGDDARTFETAAELSRNVNMTFLDEPLKKVVVYLDPKEFRSTWLGNKAIYRTRMAMADDGELIIIAPGLREFGEDAEIDRLIRKYGYRGTPATLKAVEENKELQENLSAAAHLIHGSTEGRFKVVYATEHLTQKEIESVGYQWTSLDEMLSQYNPEALIDGFNDGAALKGRGGFQPHRSTSFFYISEPGQGLWALRSQFNE